MSQSKRKKSNNSYCQNDIVRAIAEIDNISKYNIPYMTLHNKYRGKTATASVGMRGPSSYLSEDQELIHKLLNLHLLSFVPFRI